MRRRDGQRRSTISLSELGVLHYGPVHEHVLLQGLNQEVPLGAHVSDALPDIHEITLSDVRQQGIDGDKCPPSCPRLHCSARAAALCLDSSTRSLCSGRQETVSRRGIRETGEQTF